MKNLKLIFFLFCFSLLRWSFGVVLWEIESGGRNKTKFNKHLLGKTDYGSVLPRIDRRPLFSHTYRSPDQPLVHYRFEI